MFRRIENLVPTSNDVVFLFAQRGGKKESAILTWKVRCELVEHICY